MSPMRPRCVIIGDMGKNYKWLALALLSCAFFFHQADRALFGLLTIPIQEDLGLSDVQIGWINTALSWTLAAMATIAGPIGDRLSRKWLITGSLAFWSLMTICMGFVGDWRILGVTVPAFFVVMFFRSIATGGGESFYGPSAMALLASHHKETRSIALSIHQASLYIGLMTSGVLVAWALGFFGSWRHVFMVFGGAGFCLSVFFVFALKDKSEAGVDAAAPLRESPFVGVRYFFSKPSAVCAMAGFVAIVFMTNAYLFWAPKFVAAKFGTSVGEAGTQTMFSHHLFALLAILAGGCLSDRFVRRMPRFRLGFQICAMLAGAPCLVMIGRCGALAATVAMTALYGVCRGFFEVNTHATLFDVIPSRHRSTSVGIFTLVAFLFGGLSGVVMGALSQRFGVRGFEIGFMLMGGAYALGATIMAIAFFFTFGRDRIAE